MANHKIGLSYYNIDTDRYQDIKIKRLKKDCFCTGVAVYDYILCEIYRVKGCYIMWDENSAFDVADYFGLKESLVTEIVNYCCNVGLFDKGLLARGSVLTSRAIQQRYVDMCARSKRTGCEIPKKFKLLEESDIIMEECNIITEECTDYSVSLPQSKVKEIKEEEIKVDKSKSISADTEKEEVYPFIFNSNFFKEMATELGVDVDSISQFSEKFKKELILKRDTNRSAESITRYFINAFQKGRRVNFKPPIETSTIERLPGESLYDWMKRSEIKTETA